MALNYSAVTVDSVASIGITEKRISSETNPGSAGIAVAPNEAVSISCSIGAHGTDKVTVNVYGSNNGGTSWYLFDSFEIAAGDTDEHLVYDGHSLPPNVDVGYVASGATDTPTATTLVKRGPVNAD